MAGKSSSGGNKKKIRARSPPEKAMAETRTKARKDRRVARSSHGKFESVAELLARQKSRTPHPSPVEGEE